MAVNAYVLRPTGKLRMLHINMAERATGILSWNNKSLPTGSWQQWEETNFRYNHADSSLQ